MLPVSAAELMSVAPAVSSTVQVLLAERHCKRVVRTRTLQCAYLPLAKWCGLNNQSQTPDLSN